MKKLLKEALQEQYDTKHRLLVYDRDKLSERVKKIERDMNEHQSKREATIEKQFEQLTSLASSQRAQLRRRKGNRKWCEERTEVESEKQRSEVNVVSPSLPQ